MYKYYCSAYFIVIQEFLLLDFFIYGDPSDITNVDVSSSNDHYNLIVKVNRFLRHNII